MKIENRLIADLKPAEYNPRQISTKQYKDLKESIKKFSLVDPIIINKDSGIVKVTMPSKNEKKFEVNCIMFTEVMTINVFFQFYVAI